MSKYVISQHIYCLSSYHLNSKKFLCLSQNQSNYGFSRIWLRKFSLKATHITQVTYNAAK